MPAKHPIFDHIERDARHGQPEASDATLPAETDHAPPPAATAPTSEKSPEPDAPRQTPAHTPASPASTKPDRTTQRLLEAAYRLWPRREASARPHAKARDTHEEKLVDLLTATPGEPKLPDEVFPRLRWGGLLLYAGPNEKSARNLAEAYDDRRGFVLEQPVTRVRARRLGLSIPGLSPTGYAFLARKTRLVQPGDFTERFTYDVRLSPCKVTADTPDGYLVSKRVPQYHELLQRLKQKFPDADPQDLAKRAHKLVDQVFPTFLTREAAMLGILQKHLDPAFRGRVPKPLGIEKDRHGFVRTLHMNWMRIGGPRISQLDFAIQAAELLSALHEQARVMHLDLRMDNMVITPGGVGFVDFGSACRVGEHVEQSPMLDSLFTEMMRTSQIQRMLGKMIERGHVTNNAIAEVYGKVDKTVDAFYLAVQIAKPHGNPELKQLIDFDPQSPMAQMLNALTAAVLRPKNPETAHYKTAADLARGLRRIEQRLTKPKR